MRGNGLHRWLTAFAVRQARAAGKRVIGIELARRLPDGRTNVVDIVLEADAGELFIEIETTASTVLVNVAKAAELNTPVWLLVPSATAHRAVVTRLFDSIAEADRILLPGELRPALRNS